MNTWLRVASTIAIGRICCIVGTAGNIGHPFIFDINKPPDAGRFIIDNMVVILIEQRCWNGWIFLSISGYERLVFVLFSFERLVLNFLLLTCLHLGKIIFCLWVYVC